MAIVKNEYIVIPKKDADPCSIYDCVKLALDAIDSNRSDKTLNFEFEGKQYEVGYSIHKKEGRIFLEILCEYRLNVAVKLLAAVTERLLRDGNLRKNCYIISGYDGLSEYYCERLYPKFAKFERLLRHMILIILIKAYGKNWFEESATEAVKDNTKAVLASSTNSNNGLVELAIENMDFHTMQEFLFGLHIGDYKTVFENELSQKNLSGKTGDEIRQILESLRPCSLWDKCFSDIGEQSNWEEDIEKLRLSRNKVAHNKRITSREFSITREHIQKMNKRLEKQIEALIDAEFSETKSVNVLSYWSSIVPKLLDSDQTRTMLSNMRVIINGLVEAISSSVMSDAAKTVTAAVQIMSQQFDSSVYLGAQKALENFATNYQKAFIAIPTVEQDDDISDMTSTDTTESMDND